MFNSADSTFLVNAISDIKDLVSPGVLKYTLDICCLLSVALSIFAILKIQMINSTIKKQKKHQLFIRHCSEHLKSLNQNYPPSDIDDRIVKTIETFLNDLPFYFLLKKRRLKKGLKQLQSPQCDKKLLLESLQTDFQKDLL